MFQCLKLEQKHISKNYLELCKILIKIAKIHQGTAEPWQMNFAADYSLAADCQSVSSNKLYSI